MIFTLAALAAVAAVVRADRTFTVTNNCAYTVWPGLFTSAGTAPSQATGWEQDAGTTSTFTIAEGWNGRIWGRTGCDFSSGSSDPTTCATGGCNGGLLCANPGVPPATLFEFNLASDQDWYDVSNVDGSNIPGGITTGNDCTSPACSFDLNSACPSEIAETDSSGNVIGCKSACVEFGGDANCCSGADDTPATCPSSGVQDYDYFHTNCPQAYAYAYDDNNALFTCPTSDATGYTITFCP